MTTHTLGELTVEVAAEGGPLTMRFRGRSTAQDAAQRLRAFFEAQLEAARRLGAKLDFTELDYMNSSTFPPLVEFIRAMHDAGAPIEVIYSAHRSWQRTPFTAISSMATVYSQLTVSARE